MDGYAPPKATQAEPVRFNLVIHLDNGRTEQISLTPIADVPHPSVIDAVPAALSVIPPAPDDAEPVDEVLVDKIVAAANRTSTPDAHAPTPEPNDRPLD